jgi:immune inhibitor A
LSDYAGHSILLRFESVSLPGNEDNGIAIDNIAIPEIGFVDDAESGIPGWTLEGWQQMNNRIPQQFVVQAAVVGDDASRTQITRLISPSDEAAFGSWDFTLQANETLVVAISGLNDDTTTPALYSLSARPASN